MLFRSRTIVDLDDANQAITVRGVTHYVRVHRESHATSLRVRLARTDNADYNRGLDDEILRLRSNLQEMSQLQGQLTDATRSKAQTELALRAAIAASQQQPAS